MPRRSRSNRKAANRSAKKPRRCSNRLRGFESLEERIALSATPLGAQPNDTAEFMLGTVNVSVVLMESNQVMSSDNPTVGTAREENWTAASIAAVKQNVTDGLQWWVDTLYAKYPNAPPGLLDFQIDFTHADTPVSTRFEPITQPSTDDRFWIDEFLQAAGAQTTGSLYTDVKAFNHQQREAHNTNWAFTIFVVNDEKDADHKFASGGLDRAFAYPGGLYLVTLASRPASTITHETGHIFWALDEYQGGGTYNTTRGYYGTQNTNAWNNPTPGYVRQPSIMDRGSCEEEIASLLCTAYQNNTSSQSSLELIGWRDSDGDGIFDVLDVPFTLEGTGVYDSATGTYRFVGESSVQTLPNLNPRPSALPTESLQSDITINRISRAEYRIDGGAWQTAATPDSYVAALDLSFAVPATASQVEIRTIDAVSGVTSPVFSADLSRPASQSLSGVSGFVFSDANGDGQIETGEGGLAGRTVRLVNASGQPISLQKGVEPDNYAPNAALGTVSPDATLTAIGSASSGGTVYAGSVGQGATGSQVFAACGAPASGGGCLFYQTEWTSLTRQLRIDFASPVSTVSIDALSNNAGEYGRLAIYDANNNLLARYTTDALASGEVETMTISRPTADIAYAIAGGHADTAVQLDNLRFGPQASAVTDALGAYSIPYLAAGSYRVQVDGLAGSQATTPTTQSVTISANSLAAMADFGFVAFVSPWQNQTNRFDVNNDGSVSPLDALVVINELNAKGARALTGTDPSSPFIDVNGDGNLSPLDALQVINQIEAAQSEGEAAPFAQPAAIVATAAPLAAEGEFVPAIALQDDLQLAQRSSRSDNVTQPETARGLLAFPSTGSSFERTPSLRDARAVELAGIDDLLDGTTLDDVIDEFADEIAAIWTDFS
ncbi:MAG: dockerin type I domain-containing protein [Planctomycetota bacterium]